ncbi:alcohol oxidase [Mycena floridula]|nr:alcohol oxidase [Mycena floridula]
MPFISLQEATNKPFDYVIIGAGATGLTLAGRLTEDPNTTVLVLEAGESHLGDPLVDLPGAFGMQLGNPKYDWVHQTVPQKNANNRSIIFHRGKGLGGSTSIHFMMWNVPPAADIDNWEKLGNPGWNFKNYQKYLDKARSLRTASTEPRRFSGISTVIDDAGSGPIKTSYPGVVPDYGVRWLKAIQQLGFPKSANPDRGEPIGAYLALTAVDPETHERSYSASASYVPNQSRSNFSVLLSAYVNRLVTTKDGDNVTATGVEFRLGLDPTVHLVEVGREIILCAGAIKSPQILELSGIGRLDVLKSIGVPVQVALDGVGENVQEHHLLVTNYKLRDNLEEDTYDVLKDDEKRVAAAALHSDGKGAFNQLAHSVAFVPLENITSRAEELKEAARAYIASGKYSSGLAEQYAIQLERLNNPTVGGCEYVLFPGFLGDPLIPEEGQKYVTFGIFGNYPFSRGSIHAISDDPRVDPAIDPHYFEHDSDLQVLLELIKFSRKIAQTEVFAEILDSPDAMNPSVNLQTDAELINWVKDSLASGLHTVGSLSMLPREKGGVVDPQLKVYGTNNIRVADISIIPLHIAGHTVATAHVIAEQAADIIKGVFK